MEHYYVEVKKEANLNCFKNHIPHPRKGTYYIYCVKNKNVIKTKNAGVCYNKVEEEIVPDEFIVRMDQTVPQL